MRTLWGESHPLLAPHTLQEFTPYYYQEEARQAVQTMHFTGRSRTIVEIPTGGGKTCLTGYTLADYFKADRDFTALFLAPRTDLIGQTYNAFIKHFFHPAQVGRIQGEWDDLDRPITIATPQSLASHGRLTAYLKAQHGKLPDALITDECHIFSGGWYQSITEPLLQAQTLHTGLSATPYRADGISLDYSYPDGIAYTVDFWELILSGHLVDVHTLDIPIPDLDLSGLDVDGDGTSDLDFAFAENTLIELETGTGTRRTGRTEKTLVSREEQERRASIAERLEACRDRLRLVYEAWTQKARNPDGQQKRTLLFAQSIADCYSFARYFTARGVECVVMTGKTPREQRDLQYDRFRRGELRLIIGFGVLTTGIDLVETECILLARAIKQNIGLFIQIVGRGLRTAPHIGKEELLLINFTDYHHTLMTMGKLMGISLSATELVSVRQVLKQQLTAVERQEKVERAARLQDMLTHTFTRPNDSTRLTAIHTYAGDVLVGDGWQQSRHSSDYEKDYGTHVVCVSRVATGYLVVAYAKHRTKNRYGMEGELLTKPQVLADAPLPPRAAMALGNQYIERLRIDAEDRKRKQDAHDALLAGQSAHAHEPATYKQIAYLRQRRVLFGPAHGLTQGEYAKMAAFLQEHKSTAWLNPETGMKHTMKLSGGKAVETVTDPNQPKARKTPVKQAKERKKTI